jgi:hypothetical protein
MNIEQSTIDGFRIAQACRPLLAGQGPLVQAAAIAELFGTYLSGWPDEARAEIIAAHASVAIKIAREYDAQKAAQS